MTGTGGAPPAAAGLTGPAEGPKGAFATGIVALGAATGEAGTAGVTTGDAMLRAPAGAFTTGVDTSAAPGGGATTGDAGPDGAWAGLGDEGTGVVGVAGPGVALWGAAGAATAVAVVRTIHPKLIIVFFIVVRS